MYRPDTLEVTKSLDDLKGSGVEAGISISPVPSIGGGVEYVGGSSYDGVSISFGANNVIAPFEVHGYATYTWGKLVSKDDIDNFNDEIEMRLDWLNNSLPNEVKNQINEHLGAPVFTTK